MSRLIFAGAILLMTTASAPAQNRRFLVAIGGIQHESNSFNPARTALADYDVEEPGAGNDILDQWRRSNREEGGYLIGAAEARFDVYPTLVANATPKGPLTNECFDTLFNRLLDKLKKAPKLDGLLLAQHGAMVIEGHPHGDEEMVRRLRRHFGPDFPIVVTHDYHANVSPELVRLSTVLITYKQNPHLDTRDRGIQAARVMGRILRKEVRPTQAIAKPPMIYNLIFQNTYAEPYQPIRDATIELEKNPKVLAASAPGGYQWSDVEFIGPSVIVVTDNDPELAQREARRIADMQWATRDRIRLNLPDAAEAVRRAKAATKFPVALFDTGDNIGGGSAGDSTFLLDEFIKQKAEGWVIVIADPAAVNAAVKAGIGGAFDMEVGGKTDNLHGQPVRVRGRVKSLHDGNYVEPAVRHGGGRYWRMGLTAVVHAEGSTPDLPNIVVLTAERSSPNSLNQLISVGVYPERMRILVAKGTIAPRAAYEPVASEIVPVDTPGATAVNPARFTFTRVRPDLFGLK
jgi:microcystin degradation protein MlrC